MSIFDKQEEKDTTMDAARPADPPRPTVTPSDAETDSGRRDDVPAPAPAPPAQLTPRCSHRRAAVYFVYSIVVTVLSVYNALSEGSFSWSSEGSICDENVVFGLLAVIEASGLAFGVGMSIRQYLTPNGGSTWSDMLSEPHLLALEAMAGEGETGRELFVAGLAGTFCQGVIGYMAFKGVPMLQEGVGADDVVFMVLAFLWLLGGLFVSCNGLNNASTVDMICSCFGLVILPFMIEVMAAYYFIRSADSVPNSAQFLVDAIATVPLGFITIALLLGPRLLSLYKLLYWVARATGCSAKCLDFVGRVHPERCLLLVEQTLGLINVLDPEETINSIFSPGANASPSPSETEGTEAAGVTPEDVSGDGQASLPAEDQEKTVESQVLAETGGRKTIEHHLVDWALEIVKCVLLYQAVSLPYAVYFPTSLNR